jgi:hypothetical protein
MLRSRLNTFIFKYATYLPKFIYQSAIIPYMPKKILEKDIPILTLNSNVLASRRYTSKEYQLHCIGGNASHLRGMYPQEVRCFNNGVNADGEVNWTINSRLGPEVKFGTFYIVFEGYDSELDEYVLPGSLFSNMS